MVMEPLRNLWSHRHGLPKEPLTAFVLSGGAAMGSLQVGMLRALIEQRIRPDLVLGCSIGALNGVVVATDPSLAAVGRLQDIWMDLVGRDLLPAGFLPSTMQLVRKGESIQSSTALRELISEVLTVERFDELAVPFQCIATDIDAALGHWFHEGALTDALLASASIPAVFPVVTIDGPKVRHYSPMYPPRPALPCRSIPLASRFPRSSSMGRRRCPNTAGQPNCSCRSCRSQSCTASRVHSMAHR